MNLLHVYWLGPSAMNFSYPGMALWDACIDAFTERPPGRCVQCDSPPESAWLGSGWGGAKYECGVYAVCSDLEHTFDGLDRNPFQVFTASDGRWVRVKEYDEPQGPMGTNLPVFQPAPWSVSDGDPRPDQPFEGIEVHGAGEETHVLPIVHGRLRV